MRDPVDVSRLITEVVAEVQADANERGLHVTATNLAALPRVADVDEATLRRPLLQALDLALGTVSYGTIEIHPELYEPDGQRWRFTVNGGYSDDGVPDVIVSFVVALPHTEVASPNRPLSILAVDDSAQHRSLVTAYLRDTPHRVIEAGSGEEAVERAREIAFDVVLMDIQMPGLGGLGAIRAIRDIETDRGRPPAVIHALTAMGASDDVSEAEEAGADDCLSKPLTRSALFKALLAEPVARVEPPAEVTPADDDDVDFEIREDLSPTQLLALARYQVGAVLGAPAATQVERFRLLGRGLSSSATAAGLSDIAHLASSLEHAAETGSARDTEIAARTLQAWMSLDAGLPSRQA